VNSLDAGNFRLQSDRLDLRLMEPADAQAVFDCYASDPEATNFLAFATHTQIAEATAFILRQRRLLIEGNTILWAIRIKHDPNLGGAIELRIDGDVGEIGFVTGKTYWGRGIVSETIHAVLDFACDIENRQPARVFEKTGFENRGIAKNAVVHPQISDEPRDAFSFVLVKHESL
jgi:ribosomal-protein-alanine N-acetyltransferase